MMMAWLGQLLRDLAGRNDEVFIRLLSGQADCGLRAAAKLRVAVRDGQDTEDVFAAVTAIEHEADELRDELIEELRVSLTTPLDREDVFRLSRSLDDIVDNLRDFVDALAMFGAKEVAVTEQPLAVIEQGMEGLVEALLRLRHGPAQVTATARAVKRRTRVRRAYLEGLVEVFGGQDTVEMLKQRELLRRLDVVGLRFGEAADALADAALKRA